MTPRENEALRQENETLRRRLAEAEQVNEALTKGQIDAVVDAAHQVPLLLSKAQEALRASEERYRTIVTTADEGIWTLDAGARTTFVTERMASMLGYTVPEMVGHTIEDFVDASAREEALQDFERCRKGVRERRDMALRRKDGTVLWASLTSSPLVDPDGRFTGALGMVTDITEERRLEEARRSTEERFSLVFRASPIPIAIVTTSSDFLEVNDRYVEFSGYPSEDLVGRSARDLGMWAEPADRLRFVDAMSREGRVRDFEATFRRKSGETCDVLLSVESIELRDVAEPVRVFMFTDITERRRATDRLRESEERYRSLFDASVDTIITTDEDGRIVGWNRSAERMFGYAAAEVIGQPATVIVPHGYRDRHRAGLDHVKSGGEPHVIGKTVELEGLRRDGSEFPLEFSLTAWTVASGRFYTAIIRDITERKRAEEALRASEEQFRAMFDSASVGVAQANPKTGRLSRVNPKLCLITGYSAEELLTRRFSDITHPDDRERDWTLFERMVTTGRSDYQTEKRYVRKDGSIAWVNVNVTVLRDATGAPTRTIAIITDITERKRTEEELLLKSAALNAAANPIVITDRDGTILWINQALSRLTGYSAREAIGKNPRALFKSGAHDQAYYRRLWDTLLAGEVWSGEITNRRKNGTLYPEKLTITPVKDARGETMHYIAIKRDLTEERHLQAQFLQSQKMEAVGRLAGGVAHDFNNLLTVIFGYSDVLLQGLEPGPLHEAMQEVRRAGERAAALTRQLLAFSRKQTLIPEVLDLGDVVSGLSTMVERLIGEDIKVSVVVSPDLGRVKADRGQLEQVVMNLAVNARDAMPKGGSLLFGLQNVELDDAYTATHAEVEPGPYVLLAISDTGTGMDAETQKRIFEPFFTTKETGKGTGLGLSTVYGIVRQSGGAIDVYSEPGQGTTFKVYLPRFAGDAAVPRPVSAINPALAAESETVLVVEDEAAIRQLTKLILQKAGYTVLLAESPVAAERIAGSHPGPIHLMLTDVVMPGMRGPELAERLLRLRPDLRVLYMSGYTDNAIAHHGLLDAGTEFLQKPFTPLQLTQKIREVLSRSEP